jgi:SNF2 family DNA or RNA helicase
VAPRSTLYFNWLRECMAVLPHCRVQVLYGEKEERLRRLATPADVYIINHHGIEIIKNELHARTDIDVLALDELAVYRNNSIRSKVMRKFAKRFKWVWGLTGEPMPREPTDVWGQCMILTPHTVPQQRTFCRDMLMLHLGGYRYKPKDDAVQRAFQMMQPSIRYTLDEVAEIPDGRILPLDVDMSDEQKIAYKKIATVLAATIKNKEVRIPNAGAMLGKLLQCAGGWIYAGQDGVVRLDPTPRVKALYDLIMSSSQKVLVAVPYRHMIEGLSTIFHHKNVKLDHCVIHGDVTKRDEIFADFQNTMRYKCMLVHPAAAHHGLTLTAADTIIWWLPVTSLEIYNQFNARIRRVGQVHKQQIFHLQATPVERKVYRMLQDKQNIQESFLRLVEEATENV